MKTQEEMSLELIAAINTIKKSVQVPEIHLYLQAMADGVVALRNKITEESPATGSDKETK